MPISSLQLSTCQISMFQWPRCKDSQILQLIRLQEPCRRLNQQLFKEVHLLRTGKSNKLLKKLNKSLLTHGKIWNKVMALMKSMKMNLWKIRMLLLRLQLNSQVMEIESCQESLVIIALAERRSCMRERYQLTNLRRAKLNLLVESATLEMLSVALVAHSWVSLLLSQVTK